MGNEGVVFGDMTQYCPQRKTNQIMTIVTTHITITKSKKTESDDKDTIK